MESNLMCSPAVSAQMIICGMLGKMEITFVKTVERLGA